ncbi:MAG: hypothetical protein M3N34_03565 [Pseudomonadota bacterium]|nr:hypothetical protein [Pseudomonadota bacterium]
MTGLQDPNSRRALRAIVEAGVALGLLALVWWITAALRENAGGLREIARGALLIIGLGTLFYGMENVTRAFRLQLGPGGIAAEAGPDNTRPDTTPR